MSAHPRSHPLAASLLLAAALAAAPAQAQDPSGAQPFLAQAAHAAAAGDHAAALDAFRAAYARDRAAATLFNIASALHRLGRLPEAGTTWERYLRDPGANPQRIPEAQRALAEVDAKVARLTVAASDPGARVWLDGRELPGFAPGSTLRLDPGQHTLAAGREAPVATETVRVAEGEARSVWLKLPGAAAPVRPVVIVAPPVPPPPDASDEEAPALRRRGEGDTGAKVATGLLFGIGGLAMMGSMAAGVVALVRDHDADAHCLGGGAACEPAALEIQSQARVATRISAITLASGLGLVITGSIVAGATGAGRRAALRLPRVAVAPVAGGAVGTLEASW